MRIPQNVLLIIKTLEEHGYEGYAVGGCVRDTILGREPGDWDITTSAKPEQVKSLFRRTVDTGIRHGTVTVMLGAEGYEVTTYRMDGKYEDHRHPAEVIFTPSLHEDLKRRDFTINAMAYNPASGIVDEFDGMGDIEKKKIRCVGEASERFDEDALRMLRGIRFAGQLQFDIEDRTRAAIALRAPTLVNVSAERIRAELTKLLLSDGADRLFLATETKLTQYFLPELDHMLNTEQRNPHHYLDVGRHSMEVLRHINELRKQQRGLRQKEHVILVYAALLHDVAKPDCKTTDEDGVDHFYGHNELGAKKAAEVLRRLKFDNETVHMVSKLIRYHDRRYEGCMRQGRYTTDGKKAMRRLMNQAGKETMPLLFLLQKADLLAQSEYMREEKLAKLAAGVRCYEEIRATGDAVELKDLAISGREIIEWGGTPGPAIGQILQNLLSMVIEDPCMNTRERLEQKTRDFLERQI